MINRKAKIQHPLQTIENAHSGAIWRLDWGHPSHGSGVIVSCGDDRRAVVWVERQTGEWTMGAEM